MEYNNLFEPLLCIFLAISLGFLLGSIFTFFKISKDQKEIEKELDKFRRLYFERLDRWKNKYTNKN